MENTPFTLEEAYEIQKQQLAGWQKILKPEYYQRLVTRVNKENIERGDLGQDPYNVFRGTDMDCVVHNFMYE